MRTFGGLSYTADVQPSGNVIWRGGTLGGSVTERFDGSTEFRFKCEPVWYRSFERAAEAAQNKARKRYEAAKETVAAWEDATAALRRSRT